MSFFGNVASQVGKGKAVDVIPIEFINTSDTALHDKQIREIQAR